MVDIHSHFLYGVDDGAQSPEESASMLEAAFANGTTDIVATPHSDLKYRFEPEEIERQISELSSENRPRIHRGCDFHLSFDNMEAALHDPFRFTINHLCYLLVEFSERAIPAGIDEYFGRLLQLGVTAIITHPERNPLMVRSPDRVRNWVRSGQKVQITAQSLSGRFGKSAERNARQLLDSGLVHFVASDAHNLTHRPPNLLHAFEQIEREYGQEAAHSLFVANPSAVLRGKDLPEPVLRVTKRRRWFTLMR